MKSKKVRVFSFQFQKRIDLLIYLISFVLDLYFNSFFFKNMKKITMFFTEFFS